MNWKLAVTIILGFILGSTSGLALLPGAQNMLNSASKLTRGVATVGGPFELVDQTGKAVSDKTYRGKHTLVYFGFTHCPDICPAGLQVITEALGKIGGKADNVTPLFISVDPERDTPAKLAEYLKSFDDRIVGLTGSLAQVTDTAKAYRVYFAKVANKRLPDDYTVDHSSFFYLMSPAGEFVKHFPHSISTKILARELQKVL